MKRILVGFWLLMFITLCVAQGENKKNKNIPDLSGTWVLDKSKSDAGFGMKVQFADDILIILQREPEIRITKKVNRNGKEIVDESVYYTDGRVTGDFKSGDKKPKPVTKWKGKKLVTTSTIVINAIIIDSRPATMETKEEWELSKDGKTLTQTISGTGLPNMSVPPTSKFVFTRVS